VPPHYAAGPARAVTGWDDTAAAAHRA